MKVTINRPPPVPTPSATVTIDLSMEQAQALLALTGRLASDGPLHSLYNALGDAGVRMCGSWNIEGSPPRYTLYR